MRISASEVAHVAKGTLVGADVVASGVAFDTRVLRPGQAFVAFVAQRDGHEFLKQAAEAGAAFAIVHEGRAIPNLPCVEVADTVSALAAVGNAFRKKLDAHNARVVGITGSAGKTSTKNFVAAVLNAGFPNSFSADKSLNNDIGVPVTILNAPDECDALTLEMGMRGFGEIKRLCDIALPEIGVVTNVGDAHGELVGGAEGIAKAKSELIQSLPTEGYAILNADDAMVLAMSQVTQAHVVTYGASEAADVRFTLRDTDAIGCVQADVTYQGVTVSMSLRIAGVHMVSNATAAIAVGVTCGVPIQTCVRAVESVEPEAGRMQWRVSARGQKILDDTYNANSGSMKAALETLGSVDAQRRVAVLGKMSEVTDSKSAHAEIPMFAAMRGIEVVALETDVYGTPELSLEQVVAYLSDSTIDAILVKGSRAAATERVVQALLKNS